MPGGGIARFPDARDRTTCAHYLCNVKYFAKWAPMRLDLWRPILDLEEAMKTDWLRRIRGAVLVGLTWAAAWALVAVLLGMVVDPDGSMDEMWVAIGGYPGFLCGALSSAVLGIAGDRRRLDELPLFGVGAWGAAAGLLVGVLPFVLGEPTSEIPLWLLGTAVVGSITLLSAVSAIGSALLSRHLALRRTPAGAGPGG